MPPKRTHLFAVLLLVAGLASAEQQCNTSQFPLSAPTERFEDNGDGTVTDRSSGLMWMRCSAGQRWDGSTCVGEATLFDWAMAQDVPARVNDAGEHFFNDWRVPGLRDIAMIAERQCFNPRINLEVFPSTPSDYYWTATLRPGDEADEGAYAMGFGTDGVVHHPKSERHHVRLVRTAR